MNALARRVDQNLASDRLESLGLTQAGLIDVVQGAVSARNSATPFHPKNAPGLLSWIDGSYHLRRVFVPMGWEPCDRDNVSSITHPELGLKVIYQNAERAGDIRFEPIAKSMKGAGSARVVASGQPDFFPELIAEQERSPQEAWYLFVFANGLDVRAELSRPMTIKSGQFEGFHERIILLQAGEWDLPSLSNEIEEPIELDVVISRKANEK